MITNINDSQDTFKDVGTDVIFSVLNLKRENQESEKEVIEDFADKLPSLINSMLIRDENSDLKISFGFSNAAWDYLFPNAAKPKELEDFKTIEGTHSMPGTKGDLFFHLRAKSQAVVVELLSQIMSIIGDITIPVDETHGYRNFEGRAIIGFIDGTEAPNPKDSADYVLIGEEDPEFENGAYAFAQKWVHDMDIWNHKPIEEQEKSIGRHRYSDIELPDEEKYSNAHNIAAKVEENGVEQKIVRMNVPFSEPTLKKSGTYFIGYSRYWHITKAMLTQMVKLDDRLLQFSQILSGQLFFIPSRSLLTKIADDQY